ncbi:UNVERIFIED_ORG: transposase InsO family protein [Arthrobacter sp. UYCu721]
MIGELTGARFPAKVCCRLLGVSSPGYYKYRKRPLSPTRMRRQWLTGLIREVHTASRGTYGSRRIHAELTRGMDVTAFSRRIVGWSIDSSQDSVLVVNALDMAIRNRRPGPGGIVHADHGVQFTSWALTNKIRSAGLMPSFGTIGDGYDNAMMESLWSSMQIELLNRKRWKTRTDLANAIFDYIEIFYNRQRRHSGIDYRTPIEHELHCQNPSQTA